MLKWAMVLAGVLVAQPSPADDHPISLRIGLRTGVEDSSTVRLTDEPDRHDQLLLFGLDADSFLGQYVLGGALTAAGGPGAYVSVRAAVHAGVTTTASPVRASAAIELGVESLGDICPLLHTDPCGSSTLPYSGLRASLGYAFEHVEVALWSEALVDLGHDHVTSGNEYDIGGYTIGGGLLIAYLRR